MAGLKPVVDAVRVNAGAKPVKFGGYQLAPESIQSATRVLIVIFQAIPMGFIRTGFLLPLRPSKRPWLTCVPHNIPPLACSAVRRKVSSAEGESTNSRANCAI